jgi:cytochrome P450
MIDRVELPYLHACVMEVLRWHATTPITLPREMQADVELHGYAIPKGTTVMTNVWTIQRDSKFYDNPDCFVPERYLQSSLGIKEGAPTQNRKALYTFGFGRRECPGREFYFQQMEITMAQVIWAFDFVPTGALDLDIRSGFVFGVASRPKPLQMKFVPRRSHDTLSAEHRKANIALSKILGV